MLDRPIITIFHALALAVTASGEKLAVNHLLRRASLTHSYSALRHGQSLANVQRIISSDPEVSTARHGLSEAGKRQATEAGESFAEGYLKSGDEKYRGVAIFSSDFLRARETASLFAEALGRSKIPLYEGGVILERRLRERNFGELNGGPDSRYQDVWDVDIDNPDHDEFDAESANSVLERTTRLIAELDDRLSDELGDEGPCWKCILVAHGDVLQIMQTGFLKHEDASRHRSLPHLETATVRDLSLAS